MIQTASVGVRRQASTNPWTILPATTTLERLCADALVDAERPDSELGTRSSRVGVGMPEAAARPCRNAS